MIESKPKPKIGEPRLYEDAPFLYPGEQANAEVDLELVVRRIQSGDLKAGDAFPVKQWLVEPMPGFYGGYLRWKYRLLDQWISRVMVWWRQR